MGVRNNAGDTPCGAQVDSSPYLNPWKTQKSNDRHIYQMKFECDTRWLLPTFLGLPDAANI
jgi:hypothetical protein